MSDPRDSSSGPRPEVRTQAHLLDHPRRLQLHNVPLEPFSPLHVQIRIQSIGLSSNDLVYYSAFAHGGQPLKNPLIVGREATGQVTVVGDMVARTWPHLTVGTRVAIEPSVPCRICHECTTGKYNVCVNLSSAANAVREPYVHGFLRTLANWPGEMVHAIPSNVSLDLATLAEPLARVIHAARRVNLQPSSSVAVLGSGLLALLTCAYAKSLGCDPICIIDSDQSRIKIAMSSDWASHSYLVTPPPASADTPEKRLSFHKSIAYGLLNDLKVHTGYETVFETTGSEIGVQLSLFLARRAGQVALMNGQDRSTQHLPLGEAIIREIDLISCHGYAGKFPAALSCVASGSLGNVQSLITQKSPFERAELGFQWLLASRDAQNQPVTRVIVSNQDA